MSFPGRAPEDSLGLQRGAYARLSWRRMEEGGVCQHDGPKAELSLWSKHHRSSDQDMWKLSLERKDVLLHLLRR